MNVPIKLSDFFGKLSISHSPFSWAAWFCYFSALIVASVQGLSEIFLVVVAVVLTYCLVKTFLDAEETEFQDFRAERRFIAGSGLGALLLGSALALAEANMTSTALLISVPAIFMGIIYMWIAVFIPNASGRLHNFTQTYLGSMASFAGYTTFFLQAEFCRDNICRYAGIEEYWAKLFFISWLGFFLTFIVKIITVHRRNSIEA